MNALTVAALAFCATSPALSTQAKADARPNILFIIADDWSYPHASGLGDKVVKTPNIDKVIKQGLVFRRAYTAAPSCTPSRGAILTGQAIQRLQQGGNLWSNLPQQYQCYPDILEGTGYVVGLIGKGWAPGSLEDTGRVRNPAGPTDHKTFAQFLKALPKDRPFCFWYGSRDPHRPYELGSGVRAGLKPEDMVVPPIWPDMPTVRSDICDYYEYVQRFDRQVGELLAALDAAGLAENTIVIITSDNGMPFPRSKANLYDLGTHMPLIVRWPARLKGGQESNAFVSLTDLAPTFVEAAGQKVPKDMTGRSLLKILTGEDKGTDRDKVFTGRERHANVRKGDLSYPSRAVRTEKFLYVKNFRPDRWPAGDPELYFAVGPFGDIDDGPCKRAVMALERGKLWELSLAKRPAEELYDLAKDPWEMTNVADDPRYKDTRTQMRMELEQYMKATADPRLGPDGGDDRWDKFKYFGAPAKEKKAKLEPVSLAALEFGDGFVPMFNGKSLDGWVNVNCDPETFFVRDGMIVTTGKPTGFLRTEKHYENFIAEFEWMHVPPKADAVGNSGFFVWADPIPAVGTPYTRGIEVQVLVNLEKKGFYTSHGDIFSIWGATCFPDRPHPNQWERCLPSELRVKGANEWNHYRITAIDGTIKLAVNGKEVSGVSKCSPRKGYLALEAEGSECRFKNLKIKELPSSMPRAEDTADVAQGHKNLYTGLDLRGWKGGDDHKQHWKVRDWVLACDGNSKVPDPHLWTENEYDDYELVVDWRLTAKPKKMARPLILPNGDIAKDRTQDVQDAGASGIFLRGPGKGQGAIHCWPSGSGEIRDYRADAAQPANVRAACTPKIKADHAPGQWNRFRILVKGERVTVFLNGKEVISDAPLPGLAKRGAIGLAQLGDPVEFGNLFVRKLDN